MTVQRAAVLGAVVEALRPHAGDRQCEAFPDNAAEFQSRFLKSKAGAWLVSYAGGRPASENEGATARQFQFDVTVLSRRLSGDAGALADLDLIEETLAGVRLNLGRGLELAVGADRFEGEDNQVWQYALRLTASPL